VSQPIDVSANRDKAFTQYVTKQMRDEISKLRTDFNDFDTEWFYGGENKK